MASLAEKDVIGFTANNGNESSSSVEYDSKEATTTALDCPHPDNAHLHYVKRGQEISDDALSTESIIGYEAEQMRARSLLTYEEEKKLLRRIDWHIMPLCAIAFLLKNIDSTNVSNARIMNTGTNRNILKQLGMSSNEFNFVSTIYYVRDLPTSDVLVQAYSFSDSLHYCRSTIQLVHQTHATISLALSDNCILGSSYGMPCCSEEQRGALCSSLFPWSCRSWTLSWGYIATLLLVQTR